MEKNTSYTEKIINYYSSYQNFYMEKIEKINEFQKLYNFKQFNNISIRCCNSNVNAYKKLKEKGLNPNEYEFKIIMNAYTSYIDSNLCEAIDSFNRYTEELLMIFIGKKHTLKQIIKELNPSYNQREIYEKSQYNVEKYLTTSDKIIETNVIKDMDTIIDLYINKKFEEIINIPSKNIKDNIDYLNSYLTIISALLRKAYKKMHIESSIYALNETISKIIIKEEMLLKDDEKKQKIRRK